MARTLAVDPGEVRLGLAISDPTGSIARPLTVLRHVSRDRDAEAIVRTAVEQEAERIIVGLALNADECAHAGLDELIGHGPEQVAIVDKRLGARRCVALRLLLA